MTTMNIEWIVAIATAWATIVVAAVFYYMSRQEYRRRQYDEMLLREKWRHEEKARYEYERERERQGRFLPHVSEPYQENFHRAVTELEKNIEKQLLQLGQRLQVEVQSKNVEDIRSQDPDEKARVLVSDISHALNTPLSLIESRARALQLSKIETNHEHIAGSIISAVEICKAFLGAYKELTSNSLLSGLWSPESIKDAIASAGEVYAVQTGVSLVWEIDLPASVGGYSNNYIFAVLVPLLENAVEAAKENSTISVNCRLTENFVSFSIANSPKKLPGGDEIYASGYTTKDNHQGVGLSSVKGLLAGVREASLTHQVFEDRVTFECKLPRRGS